MNDNAEYLSHEQLAGMLNMSIRTIRKLSYLRRLPGRVQIGMRCVRYHRLTVLKALNSGSLLLSTKGNRAQCSAI
jgi:hypothetical protein